jgi:hypothetical protein
MKRIWMGVAICGAVAVLGCNEESITSKVQSEQAARSTAPPASRAKEDFVIENGSPDMALKSWWRFMDVKLNDEFELCQALIEKYRPQYEALIAKVSQSDIQKVLLEELQPKCEKQIFKREIREVKTETETRAVALAKIYNATPIPPDAETPTQLDKKRREEGFGYKYVLEKSTEGWKVSEVYEHQDYSASNNPWKAIRVSDEVNYPSYLYGLQ